MQDSIAKEKKWGKKCLEICAIQGVGGVGHLMANAILNFHFDYLHPSLIESILRSVMAALGASTFDHIRLDELKRAQLKNKEMKEIQI